MCLGSSARRAKEKCEICRQKLDGIFVVRIHVQINMRKYEDCCEHCERSAQTYNALEDEWAQVKFVLQKLCVHSCMDRTRTPTHYTLTGEHAKTLVDGLCITSVAKAPTLVCTS